VESRARPQGRIHLMSEAENTAPRRRSSHPTAARLIHLSRVFLRAQRKHLARELFRVTGRRRGERQNQHLLDAFGAISEAAVQAESSAAARRGATRAPDEDRTSARKLPTALGAICLPAQNLRWPVWTHRSCRW